jgi:hypothetical protein
MNQKLTSARGNSIKPLAGPILDYVAYALTGVKDSTLTPPLPKTTDAKAKRGYKNQHLARHLVWIKDIKEFDKNPDLYAHY